MRIYFLHLIMVVGLMIAGITLVAAPAYAQVENPKDSPAYTENFGQAKGDKVYVKAYTKTDEIKRNARIIAYPLAGLALIALAVGAVFGRFQWKLVFGLAVGLFILGASDILLSYLIDFGPGYDKQTTGGSGTN